MKVSNCKDELYIEIVLEDVFGYLGGILACDLEARKTNIAFKTSYRRRCVA